MHFIFWCVASLLVAPLIGEERPFAYIASATLNLGDDFQSIAAKRFLPENAVPIYREWISEFQSPSPVQAVVSGWFMHLEAPKWELPMPPPKKLWPPSSLIDPLFISIHFANPFHSLLFAERNIDYLRRHGPIGERDLYTLEVLQAKNIPSYFSGCLTLTLDNPYTERNNTIYLVDLDEETVRYVRSKISSPVVVTSNGKSLLQFLSTTHRLKYAEHVLDLYRKAKCVVTTRLHVAMPCLAFKTPVLMLNYREASERCRFSGLIDLTWHCSKQELCDGQMDYDFDHPPENLNTYFPLREKLIQTMTDWVQAHAPSHGAR